MWDAPVQRRTEDTHDKRSRPQEPGERSGAESYRAELVIPAERRWLSCILPNENSEGGVSCPLRKTSSYSKFDNSFETQVNFAIITSC